MNLQGKRITLKLLKDWVNWKFKQLQIKGYECVEVYRTYYTSDQYESGACKLRIKIKSNTNHFTFFNCYYSITEIKDHLLQGFELWLNPNKGYSINNFELDLRRK